MVQQFLLPGTASRLIRTPDSVQVPDRTDIGQDSLGIHVFIDVQRAAVTLLMPDIGIMVPFFTIQQSGKVRPFSGQTAVHGSRGQAPRAGEGVVFQAGAGFLRKDIGVFTHAAAALLCMGDHIPGEREPVGMLCAACFFQFVCFQHQVNALANQVSRMPGNRLFVIPPAAVAPPAVLFRREGQAVPAADAGMHNMADTIQRLGAPRSIAETAGGHQHRYRG